MMLTNSETSRVVMSLARLETRAASSKAWGVLTASCLSCARGEDGSGFLGSPPVLAGVLVTIHPVRLLSHPHFRFLLALSPSWPWVNAVRVTSQTEPNFLTFVWHIRLMKVGETGQLAKVSGLVSTAAGAKMRLNSTSHEILWSSCPGICTPQLKV